MLNLSGSKSTNGNAQSAHREKLVASNKTSSYTLTRSPRSQWSGAR